MFVECLWNVIALMILNWKTLTMFWSCSTETLVEELAQRVASLRGLLKTNANLAGDAVEEHSPNTPEDQILHIQKTKSDAMGHEAVEDRDGHLAFKEPVMPLFSLEKGLKPNDKPPQRGYIMSLDISEYELQMLEIQAREEEQEEESILAFQVSRA